MRSISIFLIIITLSLLLLGCTQTTLIDTPSNHATEFFLIDASPLVIDAQLCDEYDTIPKQIACYDILSKYNDDKSLCKNINEYPSDTFIQTEQNCLLQFEQSQLYAKGVITENTSVLALGSNESMTYDELHKNALNLLEKQGTCPHKGCMSYPSSDGSYYVAVCLCI